MLKKARKARRRFAGGRTARRAGVYRRRRMWGLAAVAGLLLVTFAAVGFASESEDIREGVRVGDVDVGGMTREEARAVLQERSAEAFGEVRFVAGEEEVAVDGGGIGARIDADAAVEEAYEIGREGWFGRRMVGSMRASGVEIPPEVNYDAAAARAALQEAAPGLRRQPQDATVYAENGEVKVQEAQEGYVLDPEATLENMDQAFAELDGRVPVERETIEPAVSTEEMMALKPEMLLGEYKTDYAWDKDPGRRYNLRIASEAVDNTLLAPGEEFSFNELAQPLDYEPAKVYADGGISYGDGGGLCQVSSTLFMAASYAGLEITERHPHYAELSYIKPGFDATVWFGTELGPAQDMKFKNNTGGYVMIREWIDEDGFLVAQVYGPDTGVEVEMSSEEIFRDPNRGAKWITYKTVTDADGNVIFDGAWDEYVYHFTPALPEGMNDTAQPPRVAGW